METDNIALRSLLYWTVREQKIEKLQHYWKNQAITEYLTNNGVCPLCNGAYIYDQSDGFELDEVNLDGRIFCFCETLRLLADKSPKVYESSFDKHHRFNQLKVYDIPAGTREKTEKIHRFLKLYFKYPGRWLLLTGGTGTAKTHVLEALRNHYGYYVHYITASDFHDRVMAETKYGDVNLFVRYMIYRCPIIALDDLGMEHKSTSEYSINLLTHIVDQRYSAKRFAPVWITSNLTYEEMAIHPSMNMRRLVSRVVDTEISHMFDLPQGDYRTQAFKEKA